MSNPIRGEHVINDVTAFREAFGEGGPLVEDKVASFLSEPMQEFVRLSPFCVVSSQDADGNADTTPRGDPAGFVQIVSPKYLLIPDRPGNQRYDTFINVMSNPSISVLLMIPGVFDTLRINGLGFVTQDPDLLERCAINGRIPPLGLIVKIHEAFGHCSKAIRRSGLWDISTQIDRKDAPSLGDLMSAHKDYHQEKLEEMEGKISKDILQNMY